MVLIGFGLGQLISRVGILSPELAHNCSAEGMPASMILFITTMLFGTVNCRAEVYTPRSDTPTRFGVLPLARMWPGQL